MACKIILVTRANRGIHTRRLSFLSLSERAGVKKSGISFAIVQALSIRFPQHTYLLGVRPVPSGEEAISSLQSLSLTSTFATIEINITDDTSVTSTASQVSERFGHLDVLVNNAAIKPDAPDFRIFFNQILDTNVTSVVQVTQAFLSALHASPSKKPQVIKISSARGSIHQQTNNALPPTASIPYLVSKTAFNVTMLEMGKLEPGVLLQAVRPGHCRTAFNGFRGTKDPADGASVVVELVEDEWGRWGVGFWEVKGEWGVERVPW
ncbi:NAD(P)-binding protein [Lindgomyces ingoldianus]|uniref:NAD(P)-binding protein n=1 Tax=Lindgomyces ingoldianus TaxID=673940 RepID=A0ACB6QP14_9PLEO|nr:NAD(P)-binding protein [Lindgomyces ingoldianus]KAF2468769.1 NAD(P)-binding protein [Lindgomyces ingoldianus]